MLDFSTWVDLPFVWGVIIATAVLLYVILDGFDLGCGILFHFAPSEKCRRRIMNSIAPFWDGNETWLVLGGGGLFAVFPLAYGILMSALYIPVVFMLLGLILRGVAFEFRAKADNKKQKKIWDVSFHLGSIIATFMQGVIFGNFIEGISVNGRSFAGGPTDWANAFSIFTGVALLFGYALIGSTWLIMKTDGQTQRWARMVARYVSFYVAIFMLAVTIAMPIIDERIFYLWFSLPNFLYLLPIPMLSLICFIILIKDLYSTKREVRPFLMVISLFILCYIGFGISIYPWIVPYQITIWQAAAAPTSQSLLLVGTIFLLPIILSYTAYSYYVFRGKSNHESMY